jgi:hypothetical protein
MAVKQALGRNPFYDYSSNRERDGVVSFVKHVGYVKKEKGKYCVHSETNKDWNGGCYDTKGEADKRLQQVEFFKHKGASDIVIRVALRFLAETRGLLERLSKDSWFLPVQKDRFIHFTSDSRAAQILKSGKLLMHPPHDKFGTDSVDSISLVYGKLVPGVQYSHIKLGPNESIVGVAFHTDTVPYIGYVEEVKWQQDVHLKSASIVSFGQAQSLVRGSPESIPEMDYVLYKKG